MVAKIEMDPSEPTMTSSSIPFPNNSMSCAIKTPPLKDL